MRWSDGKVADDVVVALLRVGEGKKTLRDLAAEYKSSGPAYRRTVQTTLGASYTRHYRRGPIRLCLRCWSSAPAAAPASR